MSGADRATEEPVGAQAAPPFVVVEAENAPDVSSSLLSESRAAAPAIVASTAMLSAKNRERAERATVEFAHGPGSGAGERLLEELVAGEVGVALQLVDVEAGLAMLLSKTIHDPRLALEVAKVFREATGLSAAVRRRMENCLGAAATLRAQRLLSASSREP